MNKHTLITLRGEFNLSVTHSERTRLLPGVVLQPCMTEARDVSCSAEFATMATWTGAGMLLHTHFTFEAKCYTLLCELVVRDEGLKAIEWTLSAMTDDTTLAHGNATSMREVFRDAWGALQKIVRPGSAWQIELERAERADPDWFVDFETTDPFIADQAGVLRLIKTAPNAWARGLVTGIHMFRLQLEAITGRPYAHQAGASVAGGNF